MTESKASETKATAKIEEGVAGAPAVQSTTAVTPAKADESSLPNAADAKSEDPPVRTSSPDTPIAQVMTAGAGEHQPPDPDEFDAEGRPKE
jgi:hypothetical protein